MQLASIGENIWVYEGEKVSFHGFPFPTRMTVILLESGDLWIHSPEKLNSLLIHELSELGEVKYLISPNKLHHLFLDEWIKQYPEALNYAAPGLAKKRKDISFTASLTEYEGLPWEGEIKQVVFRGSLVMEEVVFFHQKSSTLLLTDLIENFDPDTLNGWQRKLAKFAGILSPNGRMPIDWRLTFSFGGKKAARQSLRRMLDWHPNNIVLSHGECVFGDGADFLKSSFSWLRE